jgi:hypothetical protein
MSAREPTLPRTRGWFAEAAPLVVLCRAVGPATIGAAAWGAIAGCLGITVACVLAASAWLLVYRRRGRTRCR